MEVRVNKLFRGMVDVRDYTVKECIEKGHALRITHDGEVMILTPDELMSKQLQISKPMKSKFGSDKDYRLISFKWDPNEISY